jgi:3-oxoacyl-[acyl-carrier protein] reductase
MDNSGARLLAGKTAFVTGGSRGIGAIVAKALARHGAAVAVNYHSSAAAAKEVVGVIEAAGGRAVAVQGDAGDEEAVTAMFQQVSEQLGTIDVLVCNAIGNTGKLISAPAGTSLLDQSEIFQDRTKTQIAVTLAACKAAVPGMRAKGGGSIIFVGGSGSRVGTPVLMLAELLVAKAAMDMLGRLLAVELGKDKIRVNVIAPGPVPTDGNGLADNPKRLELLAGQTPLGRVAESEDVADAVVAYASDLTAHITGGYVVVDGGRLMV